MITEEQVMREYDKYLRLLAQRETEGCNPHVIGTHSEPQDGEIYTENIYSCERCNTTDCEYWADYNDVELQAEMDEALLWEL